MREMLDYLLNKAIVFLGTILISRTTEVQQYLRPLLPSVLHSVQYLNCRAWQAERECTGCAGGTARGWCRFWGI